MKTNRWFFWKHPHNFSDCIIFVEDRNYTNVYFSSKFLITSDSFSKNIITKWIILYWNEFSQVKRLCVRIILYCWNAFIYLLKRKKKKIRIYSSHFHYIILYKYFFFTKQISRFLLISFHTHYNFIFSIKLIRLLRHYDVSSFSRFSKFSIVSFTCRNFLFIRENVWKNWTKSGSLLLYYTFTRVAWLESNFYFFTSNIFFRSLFFRLSQPYIFPCLYFFMSLTWQ